MGYEVALKSIEFQNLNILLSVITVNYNGLADTCSLIDTIAFNSQLEVIVVDNGSAVNEAQVIAQRYPQVKTIRSEINLGFAGGNNLGINAASGRYLYLVNNDTEFKDSETDNPGTDTEKRTMPVHFQALIDRLESSLQIAVVCPKIRFAWDACPIQFAGYTPLSAVTLRNHSIGYGEADQGQYDTPRPTPYAHGAAMMLRREAVERVGLMPECYFLYYEELDWSLMFTRAGYQLWYEPASTIFHKESRSTGVDSPLKTYYIIRNRLLFARRNESGLRRWAAYGYLTLVVAPRDLLRHLLSRRSDLAKATLRGIAHFWQGRFNK